MKQIRRKDFIYKNSEEQKKVGELEEINISPTIEFMIRRDAHYYYSCICQMTLGKWYLDIIWQEEVTVELSFPDDVIWNIDSIYEGIGDLENSYKIAYGLRDIYNSLRGLW